MNNIKFETIQASPQMQEQFCAVHHGKGFNMNESNEFSEATAPEDAPPVDMVEYARPLLFGLPYVPKTETSLPSVEVAK